ncbi:hypothetical protein E2F47_27470 [Mycobacterium eburneum]|nr:hypothetical protein [Mycobacterium eburneum]TDH46000.1 hypothetical protein E2F47_27470 [Mycobacterium eburneum]
MNVLNYPGDRTAIDRDQIVGPDRFGACYQPVTADYFPDRDRTAVTFRPVPPAELQEGGEKAMQDLMAAMRISHMFRGSAQ